MFDMHARKQFDRMNRNPDWKVDYAPTSRVRRWPVPSAKPWRLLVGDTFHSAYASLDLLMRAHSRHSGN